MIKIPFDVGFVAPTPDNSFWVTSRFGLDLYTIDESEKLKKVYDAPSKMYMSFVLKHPRFFAPIGIRETRRETLISTIDSDLFDQDYEGLEDLTDFSVGDELWPCPGADEDHQEDPEWAVVWTMNSDNSPYVDPSAILRAACSWPFLVWRRNLETNSQATDPFSAIAPPGVTSIISKSKGIVFSNLSTDRCVVVPEPEAAQQVCLSCKSDLALIVCGREIFVIKNPLFG